MTVTIPTQKKDTTNLYRHKASIDRPLLILPAGGKVSLVSLYVTLEIYGSSITELTAFQQLLQNSITHLPLITTASDVNTSMFNEVFHVDSVAIEDLIGDIAALIEREVLAQLPLVVVNEFIITIEPVKQ